jgi:hypothetical protein
MTKLVNGFVWLLVTDKAKEIHAFGIFALYALRGDGSESLIEWRHQIDDALEQGLDIGIEVGHYNDIAAIKENVSFEFKEKKYSFDLVVNSPEYWTTIDGFDIHYSKNYNKIFVYLSYEVNDAFPPYKLIYSKPIKNMSSKTD